MKDGRSRRNVTKSVRYYNVLIPRQLRSEIQRAGRTHALWQYLRQQEVARLRGISLMRFPANFFYLRYQIQFCEQLLTPAVDSGFATENLRQTLAEVYDLNKL